MAHDDRNDATDSLLAHDRGDPGGAERLTPLLYRELRRIAGNLMRDERPNHTLQPTALVNEAYLRLIDVTRVDWKSKAHFCNMAARTMRRVLADYAEQHRAQKRAGRLKRITLAEGLASSRDQSTEIVAIDEALDALSRRFARPARVAELRLFGGLKIKEIAHVLSVSERTAADDWKFARAWLRHWLERGTER